MSAYLLKLFTNEYALSLYIPLLTLFNRISSVFIALFLFLLIFEIIFLGVMIAARWFYCNLTCMYNFVYFSGKTYDGQLITLVWNGQQELITKEEFDKKYIYLK